MFGKRLFGRGGFSSLLATYRERKTIRQKRQRKLEEWEEEDVRWDREVQSRADLKTKVQLQREQWAEEDRTLAREEQEIEAQIEEWSRTKMLKLRLAGLLTDNPTLEREFRVGRAPQDAEQIVTALMELGKQTRIVDAVKYYEALARTLRKIQGNPETEIEVARRNARIGGVFRQTWPSDR